MIRTKRLQKGETEKIRRGNILLKDPFSAKKIGTTHSTIHYFPFAVFEVRARNLNYDYHF